MTEQRRALDDPATLARGARIVRTALERKADLDDHIKEVVDRAPPLTSEQRDRLAALLRPIPKG